MEFAGRDAKSLISGKNVKQVVVEIRDGYYPLAMNMYARPPVGKMDLSQAERLVEERIRLLRVFDSKSTPTSGVEWNVTYPGSLKSLLYAVPGRDGKDNFYVTANIAIDSKNQSARFEDHVSHFLLRLYCCRTPELRKWFIWHELKFLQFQLMDNKNKAYMDAFLKMNGIPAFSIDDEELRKKLLSFTFYGSYPSFEHPDHPGQKARPCPLQIFSIHFKDAMDAIRTRKCMLFGGTAYVVRDDMAGIICNHFKVELSHMMAKMARRLPQLEEEDRLIPIIGSVHHELVVKAEKRAEDDARLKNRARVTPQMVNTLAVESFPPCMRVLHENLRKDHHLKHYGRIYYGLFLKSIGMTVEDAIEFFRQEFVQKITPEKFAKEYSYNIRYNYGLEGAKKNLSAYGCQKICNSNPPGAGDVHGCPFKHRDPENLKLMLRRFGTDDDTISNILADVKDKSYTGGCTKYFKAKHPHAVIRAENGEIYHPNQFFAESRRALSGFLDPVPAEDAAPDGQETAGDQEMATEEKDQEQFYDNDAEMEAISAIQ